MTECKHDWKKHTKTALGTYKVCKKCGELVKNPRRKRKTDDLRHQNPNGELVRREEGQG